MFLQVSNGALLRVSLITPGISDYAPVQDHGIDAVELQITALVNDVDHVDW